MDAKSKGKSLLQVMACKIYSKSSPLVSHFEREVCILDSCHSLWTHSIKKAALQTSAYRHRCTLWHFNKNPRGFMCWFKFQLVWYSTVPSNIRRAWGAWEPRVLALAFEHQQVCSESRAGMATKIPGDAAGKQSTLGWGGQQSRCTCS